MRALEILHRRLSDAMAFMHTARWNALWLVVQALIMGERLWLTGLGRARPGTARVKHAIKAVDRLIGSRALYADRFGVYQALAHQLMRPRSTPVILVDTVEVRAGWFAIVASVPFHGRSFPICSRAVRHSKPRRRTLQQFIRDLQQIVPEGCRPVLVTDAAFESGWFEAVAATGWDYVGRVRNSTKLLVNGRWMGNKAVHRRATNRAKNLGLVWFPKSHPSPRRMVLAKKPKSKHRRRLNRSGKVGHRNELRDFRRSAREPWLLATSLTVRPSMVVEVFALRMRIEETFRDAKNFRCGWSLRHCGCRTRPRIEMLLLIGALGFFVQQLVGLAAENLQLHRGHQANTERRRRVLSIFVLGGLVLRSHEHDLVSPAEVGIALAQVLAATTTIDRASG